MAWRSGFSRNVNYKSGILGQNRHIGDPMKKKVLVYHLEESGVELDIYSFEDKVKTHIYEDLWIDFQEIGE